MIHNLRNLLSILTAAVVLTACSAPASDAPLANDTADGAQPVAVAPTVEELLTLEEQANEAFFQGNGEFFDSLLSDKFVMREGGARLGKAETVEMINGARCEVQEGWEFTEPQLIRIDDDAYVLSFESNVAGTCTVDGTTEVMRGPLRVATLWVRNGKQWQAAFHGENLIVDPTAAPATDAPEESGEPESASESPGPDAAPAPAETTADPIADALMAAEHSIWQAWMEKDGLKIEGLMAEEIAFVNIFGTYFANKAEALADWTGDLCDAEGFALEDGVGTSVSPTVGVLTLAGTVNGTCGGQDISGQKINVNTVYVRDGDAWKWAFGFNSPS